MAKKKKVEVVHEPDVELETAPVEQELDFDSRSEDKLVEEAQESFQEALSHKKFHKFEKRGF